MSIEIIIDGESVTTEAGTNLVDVAAENGVYIPTLCYLKGKPCLGTCRVCSVRVNGHIIAACTLPVSEGMNVEVNAPDLLDMRKALIEILFVEGNHNCPSCEKSGRCDLQATGYELGMVVSRFPYRFPLREREVAAKHLWLERDRCIFCQRCVEFIRDKATDQKIFSIRGRGTTAQIEIDIALADRMPPEQVREAAEICPVGCIIEKGVGFNDPIGQRKFEIQSVRERALDIKDSAAESGHE
ncbi:2Fe-2S iron-sulfur cluster-binding protein [uncultured Amphritea sp.]|uniref:2Fe-2S iron-sulfur cluster-binding protein n=1 Tax=uncultured Amphritea sp. TaxID=981605 RepID=UPI00260DBC69|nr:2Fe-2S iron-sulfur cluster-binding protein [uncultured Amphritea sp.]